MKLSDFEKWSTAACLKCTWDLIQKCVKANLKCSYLRLTLIKKCINFIQNAFIFNSFVVSYEEPQIKYVWKNDEDTLRKSPSLTTLNAYLIKNQTTACDQNSWRGKFAFNYLTQILLPK